MLAICLADGGGIVFYDWQNQRVISRSTEPADKILGADSSAQGDFAITTIDGELWLYSSMDGYAHPRRLSLPVERPMHVQFSPDGKRLAVGFDGRPAIAIVDRTAWRIERLLSLPASERQSGQHVVDWSADGKFLYSGGQPMDPDNARIYRWTADNDRAPVVVLTAARRISDLRRLPGNGFAFTSGAPEIGVVNGQGIEIWRQAPGTIDAGLVADRFGVSPDGLRVTYSSQQSMTYVFDVTQAPENALARSESSIGSRPRVRAAGWAIESLDDGRVFRLNGNEIALDHAERVRAWSVLQGDQYLLVGTAWALRLIDSAGKLVWRADAPENTRIVVGTDDGRFAVAVFGDGTIRWFRMQDGAEVLAFMPHVNGTDWVAWIPTGYYMSSLSGDQYMGWHLNNGVEQAPDFFRAVQFERVFYLPELVRAHVANVGFATARGAKLIDDSRTIAQLRRMAPPDLTISLSKELGKDSPEVARVKIQGTTRGLPITDWGLYVDGIPVTPTSERTLQGADTERFTREVAIPLSTNSTALRVEAFNGVAMGATEIELPTGSSRKRDPGRLLVAAVGVNQYGDNRISSLRYAARDAVELAKSLDENGRAYFSDVETFVVSDHTHVRGRKEAMDQVLQFIAQAKGEDTVVVFLAAHGISDSIGNYYLLPADASMDDVKAVLAGGPGGKTLIAWQYLFDALRQTAGRRALIVDTCHSGGLLGPFDAYFLAKRSMSSSFAFASAARGNEKSYEDPRVQHGIFTYGLVDAIRRSVDPNNDGLVGLSEAFAYAQQTVNRLRPPDKPQSPQLVAPHFLQDLTLAPAQRSLPDPQ